jgi:hypothetical protein
MVVVLEAGERKLVVWDSLWEMVKNPSFQGHKQGKSGDRGKHKDD